MQANSRHYSTSKSPFWTLPFLSKKNDKTSSEKRDEQAIVESHDDIAAKERRSLEEEARKFNRFIASLVTDHNKKENQQPTPAPPSAQQQQQQQNKRGRLTEKLEWPELPSVDVINAKLAELYPQFITQFSKLREGYAHLWDYLSMEEFRRIVDEVKNEMQDSKLYPEITRDAIVREGNDLSAEEKAFIDKRKQFQKQAFAKFIHQDAAQIDVRDIPVIGLATSGGGYRAMVGLTGYLQAMKASGFLDTVMYFSGISGSCWSMSLYYHPLTQADPARMKAHFKEQLNTHWANISNFIQLLTSSPEKSKMLLQGVIQRYSQQKGDISFVDLFGVLMGGRLGEKDVDSPKVLQLSQQADYLKDGSEPMPIYCVVRHDIISNGKKAEDRTQELKKQMGKKKNEQVKELEALEKAKTENHHDTYQWFEFTPFEMGCEEIEAWVPIWGFGREFEKGKNVDRIPEQTLDILMGTFGSAFAASLVHFYQEIRSFLPSGSLNKIDEAMTRYEATMSAYHPISPSSFPNPFYKMSNTRETIVLERPDALVNAKELYLMDAGMDNNIPFYPLLRNGRNVDVILAVDLSADIQTAPHFDRAESYIKRRGIEGWPSGAGWPKEASVNDGKSKEKYALGTCTLFEATSKEQDLISRHDDDEVDTNEYVVTRRKQPITLAYFPYIVNPRYDPDFDPQEAEFCSTWNFVYTSEQIDKATGLAEANWNDNVDTIRSLLRKVWEKKRQARLQREGGKEDETDASTFVNDLF
ncbi:acyl transferase/acyl hydrolase/lysophospholipase [Mycotypha africana]|uniref:acyl transferase/acyl hydrolase/lysophospholipase n=1 Tax=Mycotypha africana TaxID=64632 RepID=UPI0023002E48|nr:acyl transferase/acyl hydrolase/lysophospholipase [Mycotypha africana]KAI8967489.1 acyl transferase/acyl hydrolase/lysophospholipase [Mycotypha africana]